VVLDGPGEFIRLTFEVRVNGPVPSYRDMLRFGIFNDMGSKVQTDQPDLLLIEYDAGYFATLATGAPTTSNERLVRNDPSGNQAALWGMSTPDEQLLNVSPAAHIINDNNPHSLSLTITRSSAGTALLELALDGATAMNAEDTSTNGGPLFAFHEISIGAIGSGTVILDYVIDNVEVVIAQASTPTCSDPPHDTDDDHDVDLTDFSQFQACFNGPNRPFGGGPTIGDDCKCMDVDDDLDADLSDFSVFQSCFNGPNRPPACR
jgi:hypothetical protein